MERSLTVVATDVRVVSTVGSSAMMIVLSITPLTLQRDVERGLAADGDGDVRDGGLEALHARSLHGVGAGRQEQMRKLPSSSVSTLLSRPVA